MKKKYLRSVICVLMACAMLLLTAATAFAYEWGSQKNIAGALGSVGFSHSKNSEGSYKAFDNKDDFEKILKEIDTTDYEAAYYYKLEITLNGDMTVEDFDIESPHSKLILNLNGHTLNVTGSRNSSYTYEQIIINGGGGTIDFHDAEHSCSLFTIKECNSGEIRCGLNINKVTIKSVKAPRLFDIETPDNSDKETWSISDANFRDCSFSDYGGVFYINNPSLHDISFNNVDFVNISNTYDGGAIYINNLAGTEDDYARVNMSGCAFLECSSPYGGAICLNEYNVFLGNDSSDVNNSNVCRECTASQCGGAIFDDEGYNTIQNFRFADNSCTGTGSYGGGAVHLDASKTSILNCGFYFNHADNGHGGAINIYHSGSETCIENCIFTGNGAGDGHPDVYNAPGTINCVWSSTLRFSDESNYSGDTLVKGLRFKDPILIHNADDLAALAVNLVSGESNTYKNRYYKLTADISNAYLPVSYIGGKFDFDGHCIEGKMQSIWPLELYESFLSPSMWDIFGWWGSVRDEYIFLGYTAGDGKPSSGSSFAKETPTELSIDPANPDVTLDIDGTRIINGSGVVKSAYVGYGATNSAIIIGKDASVIVSEKVYLTRTSTLVCCGDLEINDPHLGEITLFSDSKILLVNCCRGSLNYQKSVLRSNTGGIKYIDHYYVDGVCIGCGKVCDHSCGYEEGICKDCGTSDGNPAGFTLSGGNWWIIGGGAAVILGGVAAIVISKKKKAAA